MANVTRSSRKLKDEDSSVSKRKQIGGKSSITSSSMAVEKTGLRRSMRETSLKKNSPSSIRKSVRLGKPTLPTPIKRKSERVEKQRMPSPLKRSDRGEKHRSSTSSGSNKPQKDLNSLERKNIKDKKEKNRKQVAVDVGERSRNKKKYRKTLSLTLKKKRMDARSYRASLKPKDTKAQESGYGEKLKAHNELSRGNSDSGGRSDSKEIEEDQDNYSESKEEQVRRKHVEEGCGRSVESSSSGLRKSAGRALRNRGAKRRNHFEKAYESSNGDSSLVSKCSGSSRHSLPDGITRKETNKVEVNSSTEEDLQKLEMTKSTSMERSTSIDPDLEKAYTAGSSKKYKSTEDFDSDASVAATDEEICISAINAVCTSPRGSKRSDSVDRCTGCSKRQRLDFASEKCNVCSCEHRKDNDLCSISFSKEVCEPIPVFGGSENVQFPVSCIQRDGSKAHSDCIDPQTGKVVDSGGSELVPKAQRNFLQDGTNYHAMVDDSVPVEEDEGDIEAQVSTRPPKEYHSSVQLKESRSDILTESDHDACVICKLGGDLLRNCDGKGCKRRFHSYCLDLLLEGFHGGWHCLWCVKKRIELGVHSVSGGVESVWDVREMEVSNCEGMQKQKQYLVKYQGLAHIHNHWIPEDQLLLEAPLLLAKFIKNQKVVRWKSEWTKPHRLLKKRSLMSLKLHDECLGEFHNDNLDCQYEWLVKWSGLGYEHATWELENSSFWRSPEASALIKEYDDRLEKAKRASDPSRADELLQKRKCSFSKLLELPGRGLSGLSNDHLRFLNKLRECWHKYQNAVVIEDQERILRVILFILSLQSDVCRPSLIISSSHALAAWEAEFARLAPSINVVVYNANKVVRESIQKLEFYEEGGCIMFQVLLAPPEAVVEDLEALECIGWEIIIMDEGQSSRMSKHLEQIKMLTADVRLLLVTGPIKDSIPEYLNLLSFIDSKGDGKSDDDPKMNSTDNISRLKERFIRFVASERKSDTSKFVEYWVPVRISDVQLEQYCATLLSNAISLRSCSKNDPVGALRDILISARKCCDHPYLVDQSLQSLLTKGLPEVEYLDVGIKASGKLQVLDKILSEIRKRGLRVLILFQSIGGSGRNSIGDILDDFLRQRFGKDSYERVDSGLVTSKKQLALTMFNNKEQGRFVFLIENRACHPSIKLSSVDIVILFDSDWNPLNDLKALQRISIDSQFEELKVFRLYSSFTVEEKVLILAKQDMTLDSNIQNISCSTSHMLLTWGASYLFKRLDEFHGAYTSSSGYNVASEQSFSDDVVQELLNELPNAECGNLRHCSIILKVLQGGSTYSRDVSLPGEIETHSRNEELPHAFWTSLLEGRSPKWRYSSGPSPRVRKKVQYFDELPKKPQIEDDEVTKRRKKVISNTCDPMSLKSGLNDKQKIVSMDKEVTSGNPAANESPDLSRSTANLKSATNSMANDVSEMPAVHMVESDKRRKLRDLQKNLHLSLKPEILKLCDILQLPGSVKDMAGGFLEYIMNNNHVISEPLTILQAFQISVCWSAASLLKHKINHRDSLALTKQHLNFECKEEEAQFIYSKLRQLKNIFADKIKKRVMESNFVGDPTLSTKEVEKNLLRVRVSQSNLSDQQELEEGEIRDSPQSHNSIHQQVSTKQEQSSDSDKASVSSKNDFSKGIKLVKKIHSKRMTKLLLKQMEENEEFSKNRERVTLKAKVELEKKKKLESALIRTIHSQMSVRLDKLRMVDHEFSLKMQELNSRMKTLQKMLEALQLAARNEEKLLMAHWLKEAKSGKEVASFAMIPLSDSGFRMEQLEGGKQSEVDTHQTSTKQPDLSSESQNPDSVVQTEALLAEVPSVVTSEVVETGVCTELPTLATELGGENDETEITATMVPGEVVEAGVCIEQPTLAARQSGEENNETNTTVTMVPGEVVESDVCMERPTLAATLSGGENDETVTTATMVPESENVIVVQPFSPIGASDRWSSPSLEQTQISSLLPQNNVTPALDNEVPSPQIVEDLQPSVSDGVITEDIPSGDSQRVEVPLVQPANAVPSNIGHLVLSPGLELQQPQSSDTTSPQILGSTVVESNQSRGEDTSFQQSEVTTQPAEDQSEQFNDSHLRPDTRLLHDNMLRVLSSPQTLVPIRSPRISALLNHSVLQPETQSLQHLPMDTDLGGSGSHFSDSSRGMGIVSELSNHHPQTAPVSSRMSVSFHPDPLQNELARICKEVDQALKMHEEVKMRLNSECAKEIDEIRRKYSALIQDAENALVEKRNALEANYKKVNMNRILAEAFRFKCSDARGAFGPQHGASQGFIWPIHQFSSQQRTQRAAPVPAPPTTSPLTPALQVVHHSAALFSSNPIRPHVSPIVLPIGNHHVGSEPRAPAPHLQPFRPASSMPATSLSPLTTVLLPQPPFSSCAATSSMLPPVAAPHPLMHSSGTFSRMPQPESMGALPVYQNSPQSALELLTDIGNHPGGNPPNLLSPLQGLTFDSWDMSEMEITGALRSSTARAGSAADVVCLSDDD